MGESEIESPYCPVCTACGEDGCCNALNCEPAHKNCHYGETYLNELRIGYSLNRVIFKFLAENKYFGKEKEIDLLMDEVYEKYKN